MTPMYGDERDNDVQPPFQEEPHENEDDYYQEDECRYCGGRDGLHVGDCWRLP